MFPLDVAQHLAAHLGIAARRELLALSLSAARIDRLVRAGLFEVVQPGVYRLVAAPVSWEQSLAALCAVAPDVAVSHSTAARLLGLHPPGRSRDAHVTISGSNRRALRGAVVHYSFRLNSVDLIQRRDGIRLTSPPRVAFDMAASLTDESLMNLIEEILRMKACSYSTLAATGARLREHGRTGSARFARVLYSRPAWQKPPGSTLELRVERAALAAGLPRPERNPPITLLTGDVIHPDLFWRPQLVVTEVDHVTWHGGARDSAYDKWRDRQLARLGIVVLRITDEDVQHRLPAAIRDLAVVLRRRGWNSAA
jgi:hypothetical protein